MNQHHQHQQHQHQQHENNINNHNHHHYFVDGIGDGNQQDHFFDLPNNNVNSHSFIRKKGIDELYNQHQHHNQHHNQQQQQQQQQKHASDKDEMKQKTEEIEGGKHHDNIILHAKDIRTPTIPSHHNTIKKINPPSVTTTITATITPTPDHHQNHEPLSDQIQDGQGNLHSSSIGIIFGIVGMCLVVNYFMTTYIGNNNNKDDKKRHKKLYYDRNIIQYIIPSVLFQRFYNCKIKKPKNTQKKKTDEWTNDDDEGGRLRDDIGMMEDEEDIAIAEKNNTCCGDSSIKDNIITAISGAGAAVSTKNNESIMYATRSHEYSPDIHYRKRTIIHHKNNKNNNNDYLEFGGGGLDGFDVNIGGGNHHQQQQQQLHRRRSKANAQQQQRFILPTYEYNSHNINQQQYHHRDRVDSHTFSSTSSSSSSKSYNKNTKEEDEWDQLSSQSFSSVSSSHMDSPTKSVMNEYVDHDGDNDGCQGMNNVNNKNNNHDENDVEMPTPRIENRESSQLTQHDTHTRPMMTSYSAFNIPSLPSLESNLTNDDDEDIVDVKNTGTINASAMNERKLTLPPPPPPPPLQQHQQLQSNPGNLQTDRNQPRPPLVNPIVGSNKASFTTATTPAPRSISIEELKLIRMETGMISGGKNHTNEKSNKSMIHVTVDATASFSKRQSIVEPQDSNYMSEPMSSPPICNMARSNCESDKNMCKSHNERNIEEGGGINSMNKLKALATPMKVKETRIPNDNDDGDGENDNDNDNNDSLGVTEGANGILHKRKNLTSSSDAASSLTSPIPFSELKMKELIGGGGFGQVWSASWRGTPVAVKVLSVAHKVEHIQRAILQEFAAEINLVSGMRHPNICLYIGACLEPSNRAIVTELASNGSLWDALRQPLKPPYLVADGKTRHAWPLTVYHNDITSTNLQISKSSEFDSPVPFGTTPYVPIAPSGAWPWYLVKRIAEGTARGVNYLHFGNPPVLHRDLKSANILLDDSYNAKVADFGLSRLKAQQRSMTGNCGTVQWMAPEILASEGYAEPADVYSYGIILWEMLTKECPYGDMEPIQCALAVLNKDSRPEIPAWCPPSFRELIANCLQKDPLLRPTFSDIIVILDRIK